MNEAGQAIIQAAREYFRENHQVQRFVPGETYIPVAAKSLCEEDMAALIEASLQMWLTSGPYAKQLEFQLARAFGVKLPGVLVNSGSSANLVAVSSLTSPLLKQLGMEPLQRGDEVLTVAVGFPTTVNPIVQNGLRPVFVDIDLERLDVSLARLQNAASSKTRAVVMAHCLGNPYRADLIANWCAQNNMFLVEDCCDALGASITVDGQERHVGTFGHLATVSFYPAHHITMGEGGVVIAAEGKFRKIAEGLRDWGRDCYCDPGKDNTCKRRYEWQLGELPFGYDHKYIYSQIGYNLKITDMQAAIGLSQLKRLGEFVAARRRNWQLMYQGIKSSPLLSRHLTPVQPNPGTQPSWFGFPMHLDPKFARHQLLQFLESKKIGSRLVFAGNLVRQPAYQGVDYRIAEELKNSDFVMNHSFWLGVHPMMGEPQIQYILEQLESWLRSETK